MTSPPPCRYTSTGAAGIACGTINPGRDVVRRVRGWRLSVMPAISGMVVGQWRGLDRGAHRGQAALAHRRDVAERGDPRGGVGIQCGVTLSSARSKRPCAQHRRPLRGKHIRSFGHRRADGSGWVSR